MEIKKRKRSEAEKEKSKLIYFGASSPKVMPKLLEFEGTSYTAADKNAQKFFDQLITEYAGKEILPHLEDTQMFKQFKYKEKIWRWF
ncbi:MAG: hypothetical protein FWG02_01040 [Holophagaceae bacterium]|nr:hypothetical protein [Holophagaceae bacterium]